MPKGNPGKPRKKRINIAEMVGRRFDRQLVLKEVPRRRGRDAYLVRCDCSVEKVVMGIDLRRGVRSCGCYQIEMSKKHNEIKWQLTEEGQKLVEEYHLLVPFIISKYFLSFNKDDCYSAGHWGLVTAAYHFLRRASIGDKPCSFSTFAYSRIKNKICIALRKTVPILQQLKKIQNLYYAQTGRRLDDYDLAALTGMDVFDIRDLFLAAKEVYSLDESSPGIEDGNTLGDLISDNKELNPLEQLCLIEQVQKEYPAFEAEQKRLEMVKYHNRNRSETKNEQTIRKVRELRLELSKV